MRTEPIRQGTLWGVSYEVWPSCVTCSDIIGGELVRRRYVDYGVREAVRSFSAEIAPGRFTR